MSQAPEQVENTDVNAAILAAARKVMTRDGGNLTIRAVCAEAGIGRPEFNQHFSGKVALMAALVAAPGTVFQQPIPAAPVTRPADTAAPDSNLSPPASPPTDAWLERRLRVFERALTALEAKAEAASRDHARAIAVLEERLATAQRTDAIAVSAAPVEPPAIVIAPPISAPQAAPQPGSAETDLSNEAPDDSADEAHFARLTPESVSVADGMPPEEEIPVPEIEVAPETGMVLLMPEAPRETISREEMAEVLASARQAARYAAEEDLNTKDRPSIRLRWIAAGLVCLAAVSAGIGLMMGGNARATVQHGAGVEHRQLAGTPISRLMARADSGDVRAEAQLAFDYLRGQGVLANPQAALRWASEAAGHGEPMAQYLLGTLYQQGHDKDGIKPDPARAFRLFSAAAGQGNIKAMHNLAIAYAEGIGTPKDEGHAAHWFESAAQHGYVDSAFDLAVLYERGEGVKQSLEDALRWYSIAAMAGDHPSADRAAFLRHQVSPREAVVAANAAASFAPLEPIPAANML
ncbi:MAG TPA: TetR family transcriptional regulator [Rhizomicrobium sp.]|jgi:localization factor PodJL|nr:TetR family transcriptional regulator [Rhizomicrobium sp.]